MELPIEDVRERIDASCRRIEQLRGHVRRLRLERAAHHLKTGSSDLLDVSLDAGYGSQEAFTRAFKRHFGQPPGEYRSERARSVRTHLFHQRGSRRSSRPLQALPQDERAARARLLATYGLERTLQDVEDVIAYLELDGPVDLMGHSFGG